MSVSKKNLYFEGNESNTFIESTFLNKTKYYIVAEFPEIYAHNKKAGERMVAVLMNH